MVLKDHLTNSTAPLIIPMQIQQNKRKKRKENKKIKKRHTNASEVLTIFNMVLDNKRPSQIINQLKRNDPNSETTKKQVEKIMTGNCKLYENELDETKYSEYILLREKVYSYWKEKNVNDNIDNTQD